MPLDLPTIFVITPTVKRLEQKADLTRLSQTLRLVKNLHWIVVEDSENTTDLVEKVLLRSRLPYTHMATPNDSTIKIARGMPQRNEGLSWLRETFTDKSEQKGVVYFADDDNAYDVRLFDNYIRNVEGVGVWAVAFAGALKVETPKVRNGQVVGFDVKWSPKRSFATDMAGFAVNLKKILKTNSTFHSKCEKGKFESCFLSQLNVSLTELEPFGFDVEQKEILVWHTKTTTSRKPEGDNKGYVV